MERHLHREVTLVPPPGTSTFSARASGAFRMSKQRRFRLFEHVAKTREHAWVGRRGALRSSFNEEVLDRFLNAAGIASPTSGAVCETWEQVENNCARTPGKSRKQGRPESKTRQQDRQSSPVCNTSIPGSNPGGASILFLISRARCEHGCEHIVSRAASLAASEHEA
jgi:hypothetical protein